MAEDVLQELIKQAETLTLDEQLRLVGHLEEMVRQRDSSKIARYRWAKLQAHRQEILEIAAKYGASEVRVVGNRMQGEILLAPEVEFVVNLEPGRSLLDLGGLLMELRDLLGFEVYVVSEGGLKDERREQVLKEAIPV
jgi:hypothetical protein